MNQRIQKYKGVRRIGSSRAKKVSLANVETQLQSSICSKGCLKKLDVGAILMKWFRAWGSYEYEERASWILETLTIVTTKIVTNLRLGSVVYPYAMVAIEWHSVTQSVA